MPGKEEFFKHEMTPEIMAKFRTACRQIPDVSHEARAKELQPQFPQFRVATLEDYSRGVLNSTEAVFGAYMAGTISTMSLMEFCAVEPKEQDFLLEEFIQKKMTTQQLRRVKRLRKEGEGMQVAIEKAMGERPMKDIPASDAKKSIDTYLAEIGKLGSMWRAKVSLVFDLLGEEESSAGVHQGLMEKLYVLRHLIGEQNTFVNQRWNRYLALLKKKMKAQGVDPEPEPGPEEIREAEATVVVVTEPMTGPETYGASGLKETHKSDSEQG